MYSFYWIENDWTDLANFFLIIRIWWKKVFTKVDFFREINQFAENSSLLELVLYQKALQY